MKAAVYTQYGSPNVVSVKEVPMPTPNKDELLVRVVASAVTVADGRIRAARFPRGFGVLARLAFGLFRPNHHILGSCFSGVVEAVGESVTGFSVGDEVAGMTGMRMGAHAEYVTISAKKSVVHKPKNVSHDDAAGVLFGGTAALYFMRDIGHVSRGQSALVIGASGVVGGNAVQLAAHAGARVTRVTSGDTKPQSISDRFDIVLDTVGAITIKDGVRLLKPGGHLLLMVASLGQMLTFNPRVKTATATEKPSDIAHLLQLVSEGALRVRIDSTFTLDQIREAHARLESSKKKGTIILHVSSL